MCACKICIGRIICVVYCVFFSFLREDVVSLVSSLLHILSDFSLSPLSSFSLSLLSSLSLAFLIASLLLSSLSCLASKPPQADPATPTTEHTNKHKQPNKDKQPNKQASHPAIKKQASQQPHNFVQIQHNVVLSDMTNPRFQLENKQPHMQARHPAIKSKLTSQYKFVNQNCKIHGSSGNPRSRIHG